MVVSAGVVTVAPVPNPPDHVTVPVHPVAVRVAVPPEHIVGLLTVMVGALITLI